MTRTTGTTSHGLDKGAAAEMTAPEVLAALGTTPHGLSPAEASTRRATDGPNSLARERTTALRILGRQFTSALIYVLVVAAALSFASQDLSDGVIITAILIVNAALGFSQEYRSERAVERLAHLISHTVLVTRADVAAPLDASELVPGDIVTLKEGDIVPADLKLLTAEDVQVDESPLTGESVPVPKAVQGAAAPGDASLLFAGCTLGRGEATAVVYATGNRTQVGRIATLSTGIRKVTQYERGLRAFSTLLMKLVAVALALTVALKLVLGGASLAQFPSLAVFLIALAVAVIPEALPVVATLTLSRGALTLARQQVVVKRLSALEDLGNVTLLCTDKTGTLTENRPTIQRLVSPDALLFQRLAAASVEATSATGAGTQSAFDAAFLAYIPDDVKRQAASLQRQDELPFDPAERRRRVLLADTASGVLYLVVIGAAETLLGLAPCAEAEHYRELIAAEGRQGLRHLAIAYKTLTAPRPTDLVAAETGLTFLGFVTLADPLRPDTAATIATAAHLGLALKILTGDSAEVAGYVARQVGLLPEGGRVYSGADLAQMTPAAFAQAAASGTVFARVSPEQKYALIEALKAHHVVGYQGDGINDAPALKLADVGIAVDTATDVAKANADIILLNRGLGVIINGIQSGRTIFANINKYITYTMVGNVGNFLALAVLYLLSATLPLLPRQVLLISLLTDLPLVAISTDTVSSSDLAQPSRYDAGALLRLSLVLGSLTALCELAFFGLLRALAPTGVQTGLYLFLSLTQLSVIAAVRHRAHFWTATRPSGVLIAAMVATGLMAVGLTYLPPVAALFSLAAVPLPVLALVVGGVAIYVLVLDSVKVWYNAIAGRHERILREPAVQRPAATDRRAGA